MRRAYSDLFFTFGCRRTSATRRSCVFREMRKLRWYIADVSSLRHGRLERGSYSRGISGDVPNVFTSDVQRVTETSTDRLEKSARRAIASGVDQFSGGFRGQRPLSGKTSAP